MLRFVYFVDRVNKRVGGVFCYIVLAMMLFGTYEVAMRYFFNRPTIWVWETNGLLQCVYVALAGGYTLLVRGHVRVDVLYSHLSVRIKAILDLITSFFMFFFLVILLVQGTLSSWHSFEISETSTTMFRPPIWPIKWVLVVGILLFLLQGVSDFLKNIYVLRTGKGASDGT